MKVTHKVFTLFICSLALLFFTSAAVAPAKVVEETPVERTTLSQKQLKKQLRQQARVTRLEARLGRATTDRQKVRLQDRINSIDTQKETKETTTLAIIALIFAFLFPLVGLILAIIAKKNGGGGVATAAFWISLIFTILAVIGIILFFVIFAAAASGI